MTEEPANTQPWKMSGAELSLCYQWDGRAKMVGCRLNQKSHMLVLHRAQGSAAHENIMLA